MGHLLDGTTFLLTEFSEFGAPFPFGSDLPKECVTVAKLKKGQHCLSFLVTGCRGDGLVACVVALQGHACLVHSHVSFGIGVV